MTGKGITKPGNRKRKGTGSVATNTQASTPSASLASAGTKRPNRSNDQTPLTEPSQHYDDDSSSVGMGNSPFRTKPNHPKELFVGSTTATKILGTEITVSSLVGVRLFPQIKFLCNPTVELMFSRDARSICGVVMSECTPPVTIAEPDWWEHARKWIGKQVSVLRNSKNTQMKWSFMGKYYTKLS